MKTRAVLAVDDLLLVSLLVALKRGDEPRCFRVVKNGLPEDASVVAAWPETSTGRVLMLLESEHFTIAPGARVHDCGHPYLDPVEMSVYYPEGVAAS